MNLKNYKLYLIYTKLFIITFIFCFGIFIIREKGFFTNDAIASWMTGDIWFGRIIKTFIKDLFLNHRLNFSYFDFYAGEGADIFNLYGLEFGDPFKLINILLPESWLIGAFNIMQVVRIYLCGITFILLCKQLNVNSKYGILAGALTYAFCGFNILCISRHPHFIVPLVYLPILVTGIEKVFNNDKPYLYILSLTLFFMANVYFSFMIVLETIIYVFCRIIVEKYSFKKASLYICKFFIFALFAVLISSVFFLPKVAQLLMDNRKKQDFGITLLYPREYYETLIRSFSTFYQSQWRILGYSSIVYISTFLLFIQKKHKFLKTIIVIFVIFISFPIFGKIFNGGGYVTNRFSFMLALPFAYCIAETYDDIYCLEFNKRISIGIMLLLVLSICSIMKYGHGGLFYYQFAIVWIIYISMWFPKYRSILQQITIFLIILSIYINCYQYNVLNNNIGIAFSNEDMKSVIYKNESYKLKEYKNKINDIDYSRYSTDTSYSNTSFQLKDFYLYAKNNGVLTNMSSLEYYGSLVNPYIDEFNRFIGNENYASHWWETYCDNSSALNILSSVKYILSKKTKEHYGYTYLDTIDSYDILKNDYFTPIFYAYDKIVKRNDIDQYNAVERQEIMMKNAIVDDIKKVEDVYNKNIDLTSKNIEYDIKAKNENIFISSNSVITYAKNQKVKLYFNGNINSEYYIYLKNIRHKSLPTFDYYSDNSVIFNETIYDINPYNYFANIFTDRRMKNLIDEKKYFGYGEQVYTLTFSTSLGDKKKLVQLGQHEQSYSNRHDYAINLGYRKEPLNYIAIDFSDPGIYTFDSINVICQPLDYLEGAVEKLNSSKLSDINVGNDKVSVSIEIDDDKFLCLAIPYYKWWNAYVDDKKTEIYRTNIMHMGIELKKGKHKVVFIYSNPLYAIGIVMSGIGILLLVMFKIFIGDKLNIKNDKI